MWPLKMVGQDLGHRCVERYGECRCAPVHEGKGQSAHTDLSPYGSKSNPADAPPGDGHWGRVRIVGRERDTEGVKEDLSRLRYANPGGEHGDGSAVESPVGKLRHLRLLPATLVPSDQGKFDAHDETENGRENEATDDARRVTVERRKSDYPNDEGGQIDRGDGSGQALRAGDISGRELQAKRLRDHRVHANGDGPRRRGPIPWLGVRRTECSSGPDPRNSRRTRRNPPSTDDYRDVSHESATAGDPGAVLLDVYDSALPRVYGYVLSRCGQRSLAEDLTAETFLAAVDAVRRDDPPPVSTAWLVGVARHKLVDHWRRQGREERGMHALDAVDSGDDDPWDERIDAIRARDVLATLAPHHRAALTLRYLDDLAVPEVAALLQRTVHATETLLVRARAAFRRSYAPGGDDDA
jgi:RNA polymerase sigma-70 factor (ECF subfamily)